MMQRLLSPWFTRFMITALALAVLLVHPILCSPTKIFLDQPESRLESVVDGTTTNRLARAISITPNNSSIAGYNYAGCYADTESTLSGSTRSLLGDRSNSSAIGMTWNACAVYCNGYQYAGITGGSICKCGNTFAFSTTPGLDTLCSTPCTGNRLQSCGATNQITVFRNTNYVSTSSSPSAGVAINAVVALSLSPVVTAGLAVSLTLLPVISSTPAPSLSPVSLPPLSPSTSSSPLVLPSTLIGAGLAATSALTSLEAAPATLIGPALSFAEPILQVATITPPSASTFIGVPLSVLTPTVQFPAPVSVPSSVVALSLSTSTQVPAATVSPPSASTFIGIPLSVPAPVTQSPAPVIFPSSVVALTLSTSTQVPTVTISPPSASTFLGVPLGVSAPAAQSLALVLSPPSFVALSLSTSTQVPPLQPLIPTLPLSPTNQFLSTGVASNSFVTDVSISPLLIDSSTGLLALPPVSGGAVPISNLLPPATLANAQLPTALQTLTQSVLPLSTPVIYISPTAVTSTLSAIAQTTPTSQVSIAPQALAPIVPVLISPAPLLSLLSSAAVATSASFLLLAPSSSLVAGVSVGVAGPSSAAFTPVALAIESLGPLDGAPVNPSPVFLPTTVPNSAISSLELPTRLPFSAAPVFELASSIGLPSIDVAPAGVGTASLASTNGGISAAQLFGSQGDTIPTAIPLFAPALLPASSDTTASQLSGFQFAPAVEIPITVSSVVASLFATSLLPAVPTLFPANPDSATVLPALSLAQVPAVVLPIVTSTPAALVPDTIPLDQQLALPVQEILSTVTTLLAPILAPLSSSVGLGSPMTDDLGGTSPDVFASDPDDSPLPFAAPYSLQAQPPILSASFKLDAQGHLPSKMDIANRYASSDSTGSGVLETGQLAAKVWTYTFYDTGLVRIDDTFLDPSAAFMGYLPDGTRVGLDSAGVYIGGQTRVQYGPEMLNVMKSFPLPDPQYNL